MISVRRNGDSFNERRNKFLFASFIKWSSATPFFQDTSVRLLSAERNNSLLLTVNSKRLQKAKFALLG